MRWEDDGLIFVDERPLPHHLIFARATRVTDIVAAIGTTAVTSARCIDLFLAFGAVLARRTCAAETQRNAAIVALRAVGGGSTAAGLERVLAAAAGNELVTARELWAEEASIDDAIAAHTAALVPANGATLLHGSSGALSTGARGTAAHAIARVHATGRRVYAYVTETRPLMTGRRLTAFELKHAGVPCIVVPDGAAAALMQSESIAAVFVAPAAMAANGDLRAELGTYALAVAAAHHRVPFYVALRRALIDRSARCGDALPLAQSSARNAALDADAFPPDAADDVMLEDRTPGHLVTAIVTEYGMTRPPYEDALASLWTRPAFTFLHRQVASSDIHTLTPTRQRPSPAS